MLKELDILINNNYSNLSAKEFSNLVCSYLKKGKLNKEIFVKDRYDGRRGRVDLVYELDDKKIGIELDRLNPRKKSIFKLKQLDVDFRYVITRNKFTIIEV